MFRSYQSPIDIGLSTNALECIVTKLAVSRRLFEYHLLYQVVRPGSCQNDLHLARETDDRPGNTYIY